MAKEMEVNKRKLLPGKHKSNADAIFEDKIEQLL